MATRKQTSAGATVTMVPAVAPKGKTSKAVASPLPTVATPPIATPVVPVPVVALRSGPVVQAIAIGPKVYRVKAPHNVLAWQHIQAAMQGGPLPIAGALAAIAKHPGLGTAPAFMQYCLRRGYLVAV
jgi:hypothetical protein